MPWWVKLLRACSRQCKKTTIYIWTVHIYTWSAWDSGSILSRVLCLPANEFRSWEQFSTQQVNIRAIVTPDCTLAMQQLAASFKNWISYPIKVFQKMLNLIASAAPVLKLGLLWMRYLQYWLKPLIPPHAWHHGRIRIRMDQASVAALAPWKNPKLFEQGMMMAIVYRNKVISTDASNSGWGALCEVNLTFWPATHQLPLNYCSMSSASNFSSRLVRLTCSTCSITKNALVNHFMGSDITL